MKKQLLIPVAILAVGMVATPTLVSARRGADDGVGHIRQEDRQQDRREDRRQDSAPQVSVPSALPSTAEDNPNSTDANGVDVRGDGTPEDNGSPAQSSSSSSSLGSSTVSTSVVATAGVTREQAVSIAHNTLSGRTLKKVESEEEHGVKVWSVRFTDGSRVDVSQADGTVVRIRQR